MILSGELALPSRVYCDVFRRKLMDWVCHVGAEHLLDEGIPSNVREPPCKKLGAVKSPLSTHRSGASVTSIDAFLNPDGGDTPWLLLQDKAQSHQTTKTRAQTPEHIIFAFTAAVATSYAQPQDRAIFGTWKHVLSIMASRQLAASLLDTAGALNSCVDLGAPEGSMCDVDTGCVRGGVCVCVCSKGATYQGLASRGAEQR